MGGHSSILIPAFSSRKRVYPVCVSNITALIWVCKGSFFDHSKPCPANPLFTYCVNTFQSEDNRDSRIEIHRKEVSRTTPRTFRQSGVQKCFPSAASAIGSMEKHGIGGPHSQTGTIQGFLYLMNLISEKHIKAKLAFSKKTTIL